MNRRIVYGVILVTVVLVLLVGWIPQVRDVIWSALLWGIVSLGIIVLLGVAGNVVWAIWSMYTGYGPSEAKPATDSANVVPIAEAGEIVAHAEAEDVLLELCRAESALSNLETSIGFHTLTETERTRCEQVRKDVHALVREVSQHSHHEKVAS